jgi:uncharacterized membrane protein YbaN (DUF454 family)
MARAGWVIVGHLSLAVGLIGIPLPVLPTTPFLLASLYCYARGSQRCHDWLKRNRFLSPFLLGEAGVPMKFKFIMAGFVWLACAFSLLFFARELWQQAVLILVGLAMTVYIVLLPRRSSGPN